MNDYRNITGEALRALARGRQFTGVTAGCALGYVQANLVVLPRAQAFDFLLFCQRNPKPCPLLDVTEVGDAEPKLCAPGADVRTDVPAYRVYRHGEVDVRVEFYPSGKIVKREVKANSTILISETE